ncbi:TonB-dependent receptor [Roseomonas eburnea]|uniref:TonB-dependent receptor n=1 Tax=Neoroseomonas eburnea TaxID=1346889 RepID=A0A9X9XAR6_9PROT|nr:TonB-dependent receptor [Neoroseomonas eburnea]MBR0680802.1 TonB-dependent receptor [Neoroseomonas eburnea]
MFRHVLARPVAAAMALCATTLPAAAQSADSTPNAATLPPLLVSAPRIAGSLTRPSNEQAEEAARQVPGNVSVVPAEEFRDRPGVTTIRDMLLYTPGVFAEPKWGEDSRLSIRGSGISRNFHLRGVRLYQDGIPVNQADGSGDFQELDPLTFQRVVVLRGANAFPLGANTLGGAINFVTMTGRSEPGALLRAEGGSFGFARGQAAFGLAGETYDAWATVTGMTQEGFRDHSAGRSYRVNANAAWQWSDMAETRVFTAYNNIWQQIPGSLTRSQALTTPQMANAANLRLDYMRNIESTRIGTVTAIRPQEGALIEIGGGYVRRELDHPIFQYIDNRSDDFVLFGRTTIEGTVAGLENRLLYGANAMIGRTLNRRYVNLSGHAGAQTYGSVDNATNLDAYVENALTVAPGLQAIAGASVGWARRISDDEFLRDGDQSGSGSWSWVNPRFGLLWQATPAAQVFANLSWATEPPTFSDLIALVPQGGFSRLDAQRSMTAEIGTRGGTAEVSWEVALYRAWIRDEIQLFTLGQGTSYALNADRTIHQGIEAAVAWTFLRNLASEDDRLTLTQAYTFNDFHFDDDAAFGDNQLPGVPRHLYRAELRYRHPSGAWVAPNLDWVPQAYYVDNANTLKTDAYVLLGLRAGWDFPGGLSAFVEARNLADTKYISSASVAIRATTASELFEPGTGRSVYAGLQYRF